MRKVAMLFIACCICVFLASISTVTNAHGHFEDEGQISWSDWQENNAINDNEKQEIIEATEAATTDPKPTETTVPLCEHSFTAFEIVEYPILEKPGLIVKYCTLCGEEVYEEYLCPHDEIQEVITVPPGCEATGMLIRQCCLCETPIEEVQIPATGHSYSE